MPDGTVLQVPREVPAHVISDMAAVIESLPERKQYDGAKSKCIKSRAKGESACWLHIAMK